MPIYDQVMGNTAFISSQPDFNLLSGPFNYMPVGIRCVPSMKRIPVMSVVDGYRSNIYSIIEEVEGETDFEPRREEGDM